MEATIRQAEKSEVGEFFYKAFPPDAIRPAMLDWERVQACDEMHVAEIDGRIVGAVTLATNWRVPTLATLYVSRDCQRLGIGTQLCTDAIRRFVELGKTPIYVDATTKGMKTLILNLPEDLKSHLQVEFSVDVQGDEWEPYEPDSELRCLLSDDAHSDDAQPDREVSKMVYFVDLLEQGQDVAAYQRNLDRFSDLTREASLFLWRNIEGTLPASYAENKHYPAVVMLLTRHVCEHIDGVAVLASRGAANRASCACGAHSKRRFVFNTSLKLTRNNAGSAISLLKRIGK
jgi:GNAT superfamily N-acetyltransferase